MTTFALGETKMKRECVRVSNVVSAHAFSHQPLRGRKRPLLLARSWVVSAILDSYQCSSQQVRLHWEVHERTTHWLTSRLWIRRHTTFSSLFNDESRYFCFLLFPEWKRKLRLLKEPSWRPLPQAVKPAARRPPLLSPRQGSPAYKKNKTCSTSTTGWPCISTGCVLWSWRTTGWCSKCLRKRRWLLARWVQLNCSPIHKHQATLHSIIPHRQPLSSRPLNPWESNMATKIDRK